MSCNSLRDSLKKCADQILGLREDMGAQLADVWLVERTWSGERVGDGSFTDNTVKMSPIPEIVDYSHDLRVQEGGTYKSGDLILKGVSLNSYTESQLRTDTGNRKVEKFIKVGDHYYRTIHIKEKFITWDVHVRKVAQDETERR